MPGGGRHKQFSVPTNIDFTIHRYGEWTMLMLGEDILSLRTFKDIVIYDTLEAKSLF